jgi:hypothetical protein
MASGDAEEEEGTGAAWEPMSADDLTAPPLTNAVEWVSWDVQDESDPEVVSVVALDDGR